MLKNYRLGELSYDPCGIALVALLSIFKDGRDLYKITPTWASHQSIIILLVEITA